MLIRCRYDGQVKELSSLYAFSSRLIADGVETIEIPFESTRGRDGRMGKIMDRIMDDHGVVLSSHAMGSIVIRLNCDSFPASGPDICMTLADSRGEYVVLSDKDLQRYGILGETYEHVWGDPTVRLATIVSNLWYSLGCVESPRKRALRETCCLVDDIRAAIHTRTPEDAKNTRLNGVFGTFRLFGHATTHADNSTSSIEDAMQSLDIDRFSFPDKPDPIEYSDVEAFVHSLSDEDVTDALLDAGRLEELLSSPTLSSLVESRVSELRKRTIMLAEENVDNAALVDSLKTQIAILKSEYNVKLAECMKKHAQQEKAREFISPEILIQQLASSADECDKKSTQILEKWKQNPSQSNDGFLREYVDTRAMAYAYRKKHAWAVASIPIPRSSSS